jgi:hypothetical protein
MIGQRFYPVFTRVQSLSAKTKPDSSDPWNDEFFAAVQLSVKRMGQRLIA